MTARQAAIALCALALAPSFAVAQHIYTCRDKSGHLLTSDQPIPECANLPMQELSKSGVLVREIAAPLTPAQAAAQAAAQEEQAKKQKEQEEQERDQRRRDAMLLSVYTDERSIETARARALADFEDSLRSANQRLAADLQDREALQKDIAALKGKPLTPVLQHRSDLIDTAIGTEQRNIEDRKRDIARINTRFDADLSRFRELEVANGAPTSAPASPAAGVKP